MQRPVLPRRLAYATVIYGLTMLVATGTVPLGLWTAYAREFDFSAAVLTFLASSTLFGVLVAVLLFGNLSDRIGRRLVLIPGVLLGALSMVLFIFANGVPMLFAARVTSGLAVGLFTGAGTAALTELVPPGGDTRRAATHAATTSIAGFAMGPLIGGLFVQYGPYPLQLVYVVCLVLLLPLLVGVIFLPETVRDRQPFRIQPRRVAAPREGRSTFGLASLVVCCCFCGRLLLPVARARPSRSCCSASRTSSSPRRSPSASSARRRSRRSGMRGRPIRTATLSGLVLLPTGFACVLFALLTDSRALFVVGALVGGFGQGLAYLGGQSLVEKVAPADQRSEVFSLYMIVHLREREHRRDHVRPDREVDRARRRGAPLRRLRRHDHGVHPRGRAALRACCRPRRERPGRARGGVGRRRPRASRPSASSPRRKTRAKAPLTSSGDQAPPSRYQRLTQLPAPRSAFVTSFGSTSGSIWPERWPSAITDARPSSYAAPCAAATAWCSGLSERVSFRISAPRWRCDAIPATCRSISRCSFASGSSSLAEHLLEALEQEAVDVLDELEEQRLLRVDVVVDAAALDPEALGDLGRRGRLVALLGEELRRDAQHLRPAAVLRVGAASSGRGAHATAAASAAAGAGSIFRTRQRAPRSGWSPA